MNFKIVKLKTLKRQSDRYEVRAWDGSGDNRVEWRRRFGSRSDAQNFVDEQIFRERNLKREQKRTGGDPLSVRSFKDEYENWKATRYPDFAPGWRRNVDQYWQDLENKIGHRAIKDLTPSLMREIEREFRERGNSRATVQRKIVWLQSVLNYSVSMERIPYNPVARFRPARPLKPDLNFWEKSDAISFLNFALKKYPRGSEGHWKYLVYLVGLNTAIRSGEIWALRPSCLRRSFGVIHVSQQLDLTERSFRTLKGRESRNVPLSLELATYLDEWIALKHIDQNGLIFSTSGSPIDHHNFAKRVFRVDMSEWNGKRIKFHGLRHTAATLMLDANIDIRTVQEILGHKNLETTMRYVHALGQNVKRAGDAFSLSPAPDISGHRELIAGASESNPTQSFANYLHIVK